MGPMWGRCEADVGSIILFKLFKFDLVLLLVVVAVALVVKFKQYNWKIRKLIVNMMTFYRVKLICDTIPVTRFVNNKNILNLN